MAFQTEARVLLCLFNFQQVENRRCQVNQRNGIGNPATDPLRSDGNHERHAQSTFPERKLSECQLFSELPAVVRPEDDERIVSEPSRIQPIQNPTEHVVSECNARKIGTNKRIVFTMRYKFFSDARLHHRKSLRLLWKAAEGRETFWIKGVAWQAWRKRHHLRDTIKILIRYYERRVRPKQPKTPDLSFAAGFETVDDPVDSALVELTPFGVRSKIAATAYALCADRARDRFETAAIRDVKLFKQLLGGRFRLVKHFSGAVKSKTSPFQVRQEALATIRCKGIVPFLMIAKNTGFPRVSPEKCCSSRR